MPGSRSNFLKQISEIWARLDLTQRFTVVLFGTLVFGALATLTYFMNRVEYEVLYRDLNPEDAQAIAAKLKEEKRDYLVQGTSILVAGPTTEVDKLRLEIAGSGLARSGKVGYEIFDKSQFGMTDFTEQVNLQRALEGELARTISSLSEISQARVHIVLPKDSVFEDRKEEAKASVAVRLKKGSELSKSGIAGIKGLVAGAVPGLRSYNVSVVDDEGRLLSQSLGSADSGRAELESGIREQLEKEMVNKVISILEPVLGKGKVHANASVDLDFNTTEQTEETYNPSPQAITSQQKSEERVGTPGNASGVPGVPAGTAQVQGSATERSRQSEVTNYEVSKLVRHTVQPKGTVLRLSVAVLLDNKTIQIQGPDGKVTTSSQALSQDDLNAYRELVYAAVGYNKERGDIVTLENVPFFSEIHPKVDVSPVAWHVRWQGYLVPSIKYSSYLILFLLAYLVLFRPLKRRVFQTIQANAPGRGATDLTEIGAEAPAKALSAPPHGEEAAALESAAAAISEERQVSSGEPAMDMTTLDEQIERDFLKEAQMLDMGGRKYAVLRRKLTERAQKEPEMISQLIRSWVLER